MYAWVGSNVPMQFHFLLPSHWTIATHILQSTHSFRSLFITIAVYIVLSDYRREARRS